MALKREQTASMFDGLKNTTVVKTEEIINDVAVENVDKVVDKEEETKKLAQESTKTFGLNETKKIIDEEEKLPESEEQIQPVTKKKELSEKKIPKAFDFGGKKEKELKSVRKQFVFTPTYARWIKDTADLNGISENKVIENLIKMAMDMQ